MTAPRYVFRMLPGVAEVEALLDKIGEHPNPLWAPEFDQLPTLLDAVSQRLFGITKKDTEFNDDDLSDEEWAVARAHWEQNFAFAELYFGEGPDEVRDDRDEMTI